MPSVLNHDIEQRKFPRGQLDSPAVPFHPAIFPVKREISDG
jgi:hypothetical protein